MRDRRLIWLWPLALLAPLARPGFAAAGEPPAAPECKNAGVTVNFARGSADLDANGQGALAGVAAWLQAGDQRTIRLEGYSDRSGGATGNQRLSEKRAQAAKDFLVARGIAPDRVMVFGHGEEPPRQLPIGSEGRIVTVIACDVPKAAAAEAPPAPEAEAASAPVPPAPPSAPVAAPPAPAPIVVAPPPGRRRPPSRIGIEATVGAGAIGFIDESARDATQTGAAWDARLLFGSQSLVAIEGAYVGSVQNIQALGLSTNSLLLGNGVEGTLRVNLSRALVQPYLFTGIGWTHYQLTNAATNTSSLLDKDDVGTIPMGVGLSARLGRAFILDIRGTYRATFADDLLRATSSNNVSSSSMQSWNAAGRVGFEF